MKRSRALPSLGAVMEAALPRPTLAYPGTAQCFLMVSLGGLMEAALPRPTLAYPGTAKCFLLGFETDGWILCAMSGGD